MESDNFAEWLQANAREVGAYSAACVRMDHSELRRRIEENSALTAKWLASGQQGEMEYLDRMFAEKSDPWKTFPFAKSVVVLTFTNEWGDPNASHPFPPPPDGALLGYISAYAKAIDYHTTGRSMLAALHERLGEELRAEAAVDTQAIYERLFASIGGLGLMGGNNLLRVPGKAGVRVFIGCLFIEAELPEVILEPTLPFACSDCRACIKKCPTGAIQFGAPMDARKCISYLTIEKRSVLDRAEEAQVGEWLFGCDGCTSACPPSHLGDDARIPVDLEWLLKTSAGKLRRLMKGNAVGYAGVTQLRKNAVAILKNKPNNPEAQALLRWVEQHSGSELVRAQLSS